MWLISMVAPRGDVGALMWQLALERRVLCDSVGHQL
jgi:hypothetical protein